MADEKPALPMPPAPAVVPDKSTARMVRAIFALVALGLLLLVIFVIPIKTCRQCAGTGQNVIDCSNCTGGVATKVGLLSTKKESCKACNGRGLVADGDCRKCRGARKLSMWEGR